MSSNLNRGLKRLKDIIENTPHDELDALRDSVCVSELHPQIKEACLKDIDYKQNPMTYAHDAVAVDGEIAIGEI